MHPGYARYTFPLGWSVNRGGGLQSQVEFTLPEQEVTQYGIRWHLNNTGVIEGDASDASFPQLTGDAFAVPAARDSCQSFTPSGRYCNDRGASSIFDVPGRHSPSALYGPNRFHCLERLDLEIAAVPLIEVNNGGDAFWEYASPPLPQASRILPITYILYLRYLLL